jgi:tetratricopeptide (TPR) repeat protein
LHKQAATAIETVYASAPEHAALLAHHWRCADDFAKEVTYDILAGEQCMKMARFGEAVEYFKRALSLIVEKDTPEIEGRKAYVQCCVADAYREVDRYIEAVEYYDAGLETYMLQKDEPGVAYARRSLGLVALAQGSFASAIQALEESAAVYHNLADQQALAVIWGGMGRANEYGIADYATAEHYYHDAHAIFEEYGDHYGRANMLNNLGNVNLKKGNYAGARSLFAESHAIYSEGTRIRGMMMTLNNLGITDVRLGNYMLAETELREVMEFCESNDEWLGIGGILNEYGLMAEAKGQMALAQTYFQESLELQIKAGAQVGTGQLLCNLSRILLGQGDPSRALEHCIEAITIFSTVSSQRELAGAQTELGEVLLAIGETRMAVDSFREALSISLALGAVPEVLEALVGLAHLTGKMGLREPAVKILRICSKNPAMYDGLRQRVNRIIQQLELTSE